MIPGIHASPDSVGKHITLMDRQTDRQAYEGEVNPTCHPAYADNVKRQIFYPVLMLNTF